MKRKNSAGRPKAKTKSKSSARPRKSNRAKIKKGVWLFNIRNKFRSDDMTETPTPGSMDEQITRAYAMEMLMKCGELYEQGKFNECEANCRELEKHVPNVAATRFYRGMILLEKEKFDDAIKVFDEGLKINPKASLLHSAKGLALYRMGRFDDATKSLVESLKYEPNDVNVLVLLSICKFIKQNPKEAQKYLERALDIDVDATLYLFGSFVESLTKRENIPPKPRKS